MNEKITIWVADGDNDVQTEHTDWDFLYERKTVITATAGISTFTPSDLSLTDVATWRPTKFFSGPGTASYQRLAHNWKYDDYLETEHYLGVVPTGSIERVVVRPDDNALIFIPQPTANTTIWGAYWKTPTLMTADDSTSPIPTRFEDVILYRAKMYYAEFLEDTVLYQSAEKDYTSELKKLEADQCPGLKGMTTSADDDPEDVMVE